VALIITDECINCDVCEPACPNQAIHAGTRIYEIDPERCTECVGHFAEPQCQVICPVACIPLDPQRVETRAQLQAKFERLQAPVQEPAANGLKPVP
jgi:ferredoxin